MALTAQRLRRFRFNHPQRVASLLLLALLGQCLWVIGHHTLTTDDYRYAQCGRETWERPSIVAELTRGPKQTAFGIPGYYTTCGNIRDGILAYRVAGLPLSVARVLSGAGASSTTWELRHELGSIRLLLLLPFTLAALALGGCLWWVARRLFGNRGGYVSLALYCFSPWVVAAGTRPGSEMLAALGLFSLVYTAIGVSHAMQGPVAKWRPRILLLAGIFGFTAAAHLAAMLVGLALAAALMLYLAEGRRAYLPTLLLLWPIAALVLVWAGYGFHADAYSYLFRSGAALLRLSPAEARQLLADRGSAGLTLATASALALWATNRRSRYFGNSVPLAIALLLLLLTTPGVESSPWLWALPFLLVFVGGCFADAFETRQRQVFFVLAWIVVAGQAALSFASLSLLP